MRRPLSCPHAQPRPGAQSERDRGRRSGGDSLPNRGGRAGAATSRARSPRSASFLKPRVRRRAIGRMRPARGRRRTPPCSRSARRRSGGSRAARAHEIAEAGRPGGSRRAPGVLKRRRDVSAVDFPRSAGVGRMGSKLVRRQSGRRDADLAGRGISGFAGAGARRRLGACDRAVDRMGRCSDSSSASLRWSLSPRERASARRVSWRCRAA